VSGSDESSSNSESGGGRKAFLLRISPQLWREIQQLAEGELRSVNGQIEVLLREAVARRRRRKQREPGD